MSYRVLSLALLGTLAGAARLAAQLPPDKALATMKAGDGLQVQLFATEPMLINPTSMDVDHKGRVWVAEAVNYRRKMFNRPMLRPEGDRIQVLIDETGEGKATKAITFYQGTDLYGPLSVCVLPQPGGALRVLVAQSPDILEFWDRDGDLKADGPPTKFLTGFGGFDHDHGVHGLSVGPDGKLYFTVGDAGVKGLQAKDGKGPKFTSNATDCRAGTVWRCDLDGTNLELIAHNFRNNYECCVDSFGEIWLSDNDDDGNQQTRICHVMPGGNYGYHPRGPGQSHWHEEQPGVVHKTLRTGFGSPTGICFYEGNLLPEKFRGQLIHADAGPREIRCFHREPKGAGYELDKTLMLTSSDTWFRPSDVTVAPDGSVFVCDWYDPGVGGHGMGDWTRGRVYRLTPTGHKGYRVPELKLDGKEGVLAALGSPNLTAHWMGYLATREMGRAEINGILEPALQSGSMALQARAFWAITETVAANSKNDPKEFTAVGFAMMLRDKNSERFLPTAFRMDRTLFHRSTLEVPQFSDPESWKVTEGLDPAAIRELLINARTTDPAVLKGPFYAFAKKYDGKDIFYRAALNIACGTDPARRDAILADFDKHFPEWNDTVADLVWELRPKSVLPRLEKLLGDAKLIPAQKARVVDILAANDDPAAGKTMLALATAADQTAEVKAKAVENLKLFLPTKWKELNNGTALKDAVTVLLGDPATTTLGLRLAAVVPAAVEDVSRVLASGAAPAKLEAVRTLGKIPDPYAVGVLEKHLADPVFGPEAVKALGEQAAGRGDTPAAKAGLAALQKAVAGGAGHGSGIRQGALAALAGTRTGTGWLLKQKEDGKLPADLTADAGRLLRNSPFQGERNKAMLLFPAPGKLDLKKLPAPAELAKRLGSAENGKAVMTKSLTAETQCLKCHTVRGIGGQIGPDLSMIGKKGSREDLFKSILQPSAAIADQFVSWKIDTADGQSLTGLLVGESETTLTVRDANGKDYAVPVKDVEKRTKSLISLMPDNLAAALTEDELVDLVAYLATLQSPALTPDRWQVLGPFDSPEGNAGLDVKYGPETAEYAEGTKFKTKAGDSTWRTVRPGANGYIDLAALYGSAGERSVSFLYREIESPADQDATILLGTDDGCVLTVNGSAVFTSRQTRAAAPGQNAVPVKLKAGVNKVLLKIANGNNPHGAYVTILSGQELKAK